MLICIHDFEMIPRPARDLRLVMCLLGIDYDPECMIMELRQKALARAGLSDEEVQDAIENRAQVAPATFITGKCEGREGWVVGIGDWGGGGLEHGSFHNVDMSRS